MSVPSSSTSSSSPPSPSRSPRTPTFLSEAKTKNAIGQASFGGSAPVRGAARIVPFFERGDAEASTPAVAAEIPAMEPPPEIEPLAPPLPPPSPTGSREATERLARAIAGLRATADELAEQAASDALEIALLVARRILEAELTTSTGALPALIRSAVRRLGEARRITVRLCPTDAAAIEAAGEAGLGASANLTSARIEIRADGSLAPGDCVVDGDESAVDGRLGSRLEEVRRILSAALIEPPEVEP